MIRTVVRARPEDIERVLASAVQAVQARARTGLLEQSQLQQAVQHIMRQPHCALMLQAPHHKRAPVTRLSALYWRSGGRVYLVVDARRIKGAAHTVPLLRCGSCFPWVAWCALTAVAPERTQRLLDAHIRRAVKAGMAPPPKPITADAVLSIPVRRGPYLYVQTEDGFGNFGCPDGWYEVLHTPDAVEVAPYVFGPNAPESVRRLMSRRYWPLRAAVGDLRNDYCAALVDAGPGAALLAAIVNAAGRRVAELRSERHKRRFVPGTTSIWRRVGTLQLHIKILTAVKPCDGRYSLWWITEDRRAFPSKEKAEAWEAGLPDPTAPDTLGWKVWVMGPDGTLLSPFRHIRWESSVLRTETWDESNVLRGGAGIHARRLPRNIQRVADPTDYFDLTGVYPRHNNFVIVDGVVERFGQYVLGTDGWRAEEVRILRLFAPEAASAALLAARYPDVEVLVRGRSGSEATERSA